MACLRGVDRVHIRDVHIRDKERARRQGRHCTSDWHDGVYIFRLHYVVHQIRRSDVALYELEIGATAHGLQSAARVATQTTAARINKRFDKRSSVKIAFLCQIEANI